METIKKAIETLLLNVANLLKIKSIISLTVVTALTVAFLQGNVAIEVYAPLATMIMTHFFSKDEKK